MDSAKQFEKAFAIAKKNFDKNGEECIIYIPIGIPPFATEVNRKSKKERRGQQKVFFLHERIEKRMEICIGEYGLCLREVVCGIRNNKSHEIIKTNYYSSFILKWINGDYIQVIHGRIASTKLS